MHDLFFAFISGYGSAKFAEIGRDFTRLQFNTDCHVFLTTVCTPPLNKNSHIHTHTQVFL